VSHQQPLPHCTNTTVVLVSGIADEWFEVAGLWCWHANHIHAMLAMHYA